MGAYSKDLRFNAPVAMDRRMPRKEVTEVFDISKVLLY